MERDQQGIDGDGHFSESERRARIGSVAPQAETAGTFAQSPEVQKTSYFQILTAYYSPEKVGNKPVLSPIPASEDISGTGRG